MPNKTSYRATLPETAAAAIAGAAAASILLRALSGLTGHHQARQLRINRELLASIEAELSALKPDAANHKPGEAAATVDPTLLKELQAQVEELESNRAKLIRASSNSRSIVADGEAAAQAESEPKWQDMLQEVKRLRDFLKDAEKGAAEKAKLLKTVSTKLTSAQVAAEKAAKELEKFKSQAKSTEERLEKAHGSSGQLDVQLLTAKKKLESTEVALREAGKQLEQSRSQMAELEKLVKQKGQALTKLEGDVAKMKKEEAKSVALEHEVTEVRAQRDHVQSQLTSVLQEHATASSTSSGAKDIAEKAAAEAAAASSAAAEAVKGLTKKVEGLMAAHKQLTGSLQRSRVEKKVVEAAHACALGEKDRSLTGIAEIEGKVASINAEMEKMRQQMEAQKKESEKQLSLAEQKATAAAKLAAELESKVAKLEKENKSLSDSAAGSTADALVALKESASKLEGEKKAVEVQVRAKEEEVTKMKADFKALQEKFYQMDSAAASSNEVSQSTSDQAQQLLRDYQLLKEKHLALVNDTKMKDEMMEILQEQLFELADVDLGSVLQQPLGTYTSRSKSRGGSAGGD